MLRRETCPVDCFPRLAQCRLHRSGVRPAGALLEGDGAIDDAHEPRVEAVRDRGERAGRKVRRGDEHLGGALTGVHGLAGDQREERRTDRPDVGLRVDLRAISDRLLRRHEARRAEEKARRRLLGAEARLHLREAEVEDLEATFLRDEQVVGLDVAMDDALLVRRGEHVEQLLAHLVHVGERKATALPDAARLEQLAFEQLHDEIGVTVLARVVVEDSHDAGMVHLVRRVALLEEAATSVDVARELGVQDLDGRATAVVLVRRGVDGADAATGDARVDPPLVAKNATYPASAVESLSSHGRLKLVVTKRTIPMMKIERHTVPTTISMMTCGVSFCARPPPGAGCGCIHGCWPGIGCICWGPP